MLNKEVMIVEKSKLRCLLSSLNSLELQIIQMKKIIRELRMEVLNGKENN